MKRRIWLFAQSHIKNGYLSHKYNRLECIAMCIRQTCAAVEKQQPRSSGSYDNIKAQAKIYRIQWQSGSPGSRSHRARWQNNSSRFKIHTTPPQIRGLISKVYTIQWQNAKHKILDPQDRKKSMFNNNDPLALAYLENRQGLTTPRGRTLLPKGRTVEKAPPVPWASFLDLILGTPSIKISVDLFWEQLGWKFLLTFYRALGGNLARGRTAPSAPKGRGTCPNVPSLNTPLSIRSQN